VAAWGDNYFGQTNVPSDLTNAVGIAAGSFHALALRADGTVVGWGGTNYGAIDVPPGLCDAVAVAAGWWHSLALKADGTVVVWGLHTQPPEPLTSVVAIAAGSTHDLVLKADGTVVAWGGTEYFGYEWVPVPAGLTNAVAIAAGVDMSLALWGEALPTAEIWNPTCGTGMFSCSVNTIRGWSYRLEYKDSLDQPTWWSLAPVPGDNTIKTLTDSNPAGSRRFYRVRVQ
jgi:alpha-tubulin suppressor-like RCC1 family protein